MSSNRRWPSRPVKGGKDTNQVPEASKYIGLSKMFETGVFSDVDVRIGAGDKEKTFKLHKGILSQNSEYFRVMFANNNFKEGNGGTVDLPEHDPFVFQLVLRWLYEGQVPRSSNGSAQRLDYVMKMFQYGGYFQIPSLKEKTISMLTARLGWKDNRSIYNIGGRLEHYFNQAFETLFDTYSSEKAYFDPVVRAICVNHYLKRILAVPRLKELLHEEPELLMKLLEVHLDGCGESHVDQDDIETEEDSDMSSHSD